MTTSQVARTKVFISYSHKDTKWLERLQVHLKPLVREGYIELWDDTRIQPCDDWKTEIGRALAKAQIAVFLISPDFLASDFIHDEELPMLLEAAEKRGTRILPVILNHCLYVDSKLGRFQAINSPDKPLEGLTKAGRDKALRDLARAIAAGLSAGPSARVPSESKPASDQNGTGRTRKNPPSSSSEKRNVEHQSLGTWVFGGLLLLFLFAVFSFAPAMLPEYKHRILAVCAALLAGLFGWFLSGDIGVHIKALKSRFGEVAIRATGGLALFVVVLMWWLSPLAPVRGNVPDNDNGIIVVQERMQTLAGDIRDARGEPIAGVQVSLPTFGRTVRSDDLGHFSLQVESTPQATVELMARKPGYLTHEQYATLGNTSLGFTLEKSKP